MKAQGLVACCSSTLGLLTNSLHGYHVPNFPASQYCLYNHVLEPLKREILLADRFDVLKIGIKLIISTFEHHKVNMKSSLFWMAQSQKQLGVKSQKHFSFANCLIYIMYFYYISTLAKHNKLPDTDHNGLYS